MKALTLAANKNITEFSVFVATSLLSTTVLCYIDEGYNNFSWATDLVNWFWFFVYASGFILGQFTFNSYILKKYSGRFKIVLSCLIGLPLGFVFTLVFILLFGCVVLIFS